MMKNIIFKEPFVRINLIKRCIDWEYWSENWKRIDITRKTIRKSIFRLTLSFHFPRHPESIQVEVETDASWVLPRRNDKK